MLAKMGVRVNGLKRGARRALNPVEKVCVKHGVTAVLTSCNDGNHMPSSLHYDDNAFDLTTAKISTLALDKIALAIKQELGPEYDVILGEDYIHVEYDPK